MINFPKDQWEADKQELKSFVNDWGNEWKALGWNALIPIISLVALVASVIYAVIH